MQRHRVLIVFGIAWLSALLLSWWVFQRSTAPEARDVVPVVAAVQDMPLGRRLQASDLKLIGIDRKNLPRGFISKIADAADRSLAVPVAVNEPVLTGKLNAKGSGEGLTSLIEPGTRAVSVQVNEISGVSGFIQPGTRVDILFTRVFSNGDAATTTILQNVKVLAYGRQIDPATKVDPRDTTRPTVATLLVTQDEAERLVLAGQRGRIHFSLRNGLDDQVADPSEPVKSADLGIPEPVKPKPPEPQPTPAQIAKAVAAAAPPPKPPRIVRIYRGDKLTEVTLK